MHVALKLAVFDSFLDLLPEASVADDQKHNLFFLPPKPFENIDHKKNILRLFKSADKERDKLTPVLVSEFLDANLLLFIARKKYRFIHRSTDKRDFLAGNAERE